MLEAFETSTSGAAAGLTAGAPALYLGDRLIDRRGGHGRKSMEPPSSLAGGAGAIVLGTVLDGIPESLVLGASLQSEGVVAHTLFPEAIDLGGRESGLLTALGFYLSA